MANDYFKKMNKARKEVLKVSLTTVRRILQKN